MFAHGTCQVVGSEPWNRRLGRGHLCSPPRDKQYDLPLPVHTLLLSLRFSSVQFGGSLQVICRDCPNGTEAKQNGVNILAEYAVQRSVLQ